MNLFETLKFNKLETRSYKLNKGMTYIELIVVLSIFAIISSVAVFNYGEFQSKVDIKNLANDMALKIVQAQKAASFGEFPSLEQQLLITSTWKPSYGIYINRGVNNKSLIYFTDLDNDNLYSGTSCTGECIEEINITKGNSISRLDVFYIGDPTPHEVADLTLSFTRPSSTATAKSSSGLNPNIFYVQITVISPKSVQAVIKLYSSGRVQIN